MCEIIISLKPKFSNLIETKVKTHEFRKKVPKIKPNKIWIYVSYPVSKLTYVAMVNNYVEFPQKISENGIGNMDFNEGKKSKYAYPIISLYKLKKPIALEELRTNYNFVAPQNYTFVDKYIKLKHDISSTDKLFKVF